MIRLDLVIRRHTGGANEAFVSQERNRLRITGGSITRVAQVHVTKRLSGDGHQLE